MIEWDEKFKKYLLDKGLLAKYNANFYRYPDNRHSFKDINEFLIGYPPEYFLEFAFIWCDTLGDEGQSSSMWHEVNSKWLATIKRAKVAEVIKREKVT